MIFYKSDYTIEKVLKDTPTQESVLIKKYLGMELSKREAKYLWKRIVDHKWYLSERLKRDVGFRVAAVDYVENFYEPFFFNSPTSGFKNSIRELFKIISQTEFLRPKPL